MNYIIAINGVAVNFSQHEDNARAIASSIPGAKVYRGADVLDAEEDIVIFFGREYVEA